VEPHDTSERGRLIWKVGDLILEHAEELAQLESLVNGKPVGVALAADVPLAADLFHYMAGWATKIEGNTIDISPWPPRPAPGWPARRPPRRCCPGSRPPPRCWIQGWPLLSAPRAR
jgi:acyl-CoA reductase-like NAD-dependent aldehyde dehydrogenase